MKFVIYSKKTVLVGLVFVGFVVEGCKTNNSGEGNEMTRDSSDLLNQRELLTDGSYNPRTDPAGSEINLRENLPDPLQLKLDQDSDIKNKKIVHSTSMIRDGKTYYRIQFDGDTSLYIFDAEGKSFSGHKQ